MTRQALILLVALLVPRLAHAADGQDFSAQGQAIYRIVACGDAATGLSEADAKVVAAHCKKVAAAVVKLHERWLDKATPFLASIVPAGLPTEVVYPFGGGDLMTALATYPSATTFTTISLEGAGDPRIIDSLSGKKLEKALAAQRQNYAQLLSGSWNATISLNQLANSGLPADLSLTLVSLSVHGYEPVMLRYLRLEDDGSLHYLTAADIAEAEDAAKPKTKKDKNKARKKLLNEVQVSLWNNAELTFRKRGDAKAPLLTFRHFTADLSDAALATDGPLLKHLAAKGKVAAMTKAASYLLWYKSFSHIRDYLLANMVFMLSDDTGIPPNYAEPAGFEQDTYGGPYTGPYFTLKDKTTPKHLVKLWKKNQKRELTIGYGYPDSSGHKILLVTRKK